MTSSLAILLVWTGLSLDGAALYRPAPDSDPQEIKAAALDAGFSARAAEAEFRVRPAGIAWLADAGLSTPKYVRLQFPVGVKANALPDGGTIVILPDLPWRFLDPTGATLADATLATCAARPGVCTLYGRDRPFRVVAHHCAWKPSAGAVCTKLDGGDPGVENTMQPGQWVGAGCQRSHCTGIAGDP